METSSYSSSVLLRPNFEDVSSIAEEEPVTKDIEY